MSTWKCVPRKSGIRHYESDDGRHEIVNAHPHRTFGTPWKLYAQQTFLGSFATLKDAKASAEYRIEKRQVT